MLQITVNKETTKASVVFDGKEQELRLVKVNKAGVKPGTYWVDMQKLGTPKKWATVNFNNYSDNIFVIDVDEDAHRVATKKDAHFITLVNIKEYLDEETGAQFDEIMEKAKARRDEIVAEELANKPVKEKKSRRMTPEEAYAKKLKELEEIKKIIEEGGELPKRGKKKAEAIENLDEAITDGLEG